MQCILSERTLNRPVGITKYEVMKLINFMKFAFYSIINILTHQKPDSHSALAFSLVRVSRSNGNIIKTDC